MNIRPWWSSLRLAIYLRDNFTCRHCQLIFGYPAGYDGTHALDQPAVNRHGKATLYILELDHIVPWSRGGHTTYANLQALCTGCNARKGAHI